MVVNDERFEKNLEKALQLDMLYSVRAERDLLKERYSQFIPAAVLILFASSQNHHMHLLFTRRTDIVGTHKGQMAFPGGHCEPEDFNGPVGTALRETEEEIGISQKEIQIKGKLPTLLTATGYSIEPIVGILRPPLEEISFQLDSFEIAEALWIPLETLLCPGVYRKENYLAGHQSFPIDVYQVDHYRIWGATGSMTKNILDRLKSLS